MRRACFAGVLLALAPLYLVNLPSAGGRWLAAGSLLSGLIVVVVVLVREARGDVQLYAALAVTNSVALLAVSAARQSSLALMATFVALGGMGLRRSLAARWMVIGVLSGVVVAQWRIEGRGADRVTAALVVVAVLAGLLHRERSRAESALQESEQRYRQLFDCGPVGIGVVDHDGVFTAVNAAMAAIVGREPSELIGRTSAVYTHPDDAHLVARIQLPGIESVGHSLRKRVVRPDGVVRWVDLTASTNPGVDGRTWTVGHLRDVTEQVDAEQQLLRVNQDLEAVAEVVRRMHSGDDVRRAVVDGARDIAGATSASLFELQGDQLCVTTEAGDLLLGVCLPEGEGSGVGHVWLTGEPLFAADPLNHPLVSQSLLEGKPVSSLLWQPVTVQGHVVAVLVVAWPQRVSDLDDRAARAVQLLAGEAALALERESLFSSLGQQARCDALTGLANRRSWDEALAAAMARARRTGAPLTVVLIDVDNFKAYNDANGHGAGDVVLRDFAQAARTVVRDVDVLARWGGEEFTLMLSDCGHGPDAVAAIDRVRDCMPAETTCSAGFATWDGLETAQQLMRRADAGLYVAKHRGRDCAVEAPLAATVVAVQREPVIGPAVIRAEPAAPALSEP